MKYLATLTILAATVLPVCADFQGGLKAYESGDYASALREWQPLAEKGDANAQYNLGLLYAKGQGVKQDYAEAANWYRKAADQGVPGAQYNLGVMYSNGQGVPQDAQEAMKWYMKAADQGLSRAANNLGAMHDEGAAFKNFAEAERWYRKAAEKGIASAQFNLGVMYDIGQGVTRNYDEAIKWYRKAAEQGNAAAQTNLAILYYNAQGTQRDLLQAYCWFARAKEAGEPRAAGLLQVTAEKMRPRDIEKAKELLAGWKPQPVKVEETVELASADRALRQVKSEAPAVAPPVVTVAKAPTPAVAPPRREPVKQDTWTGVERIVAIGDVHGDYEQLVAVLKSAGLIDDTARWSGGKAHLVQTGDILDRGPSSREVMDLLMRLENEAQAAGGYVHLLLGNHEAMNVYGDLRYVSPGEFAAFRTERSEQVREQAFRAVSTDPAKPELNHANWETQHPAGMAEHRAQLGPEGHYGKWLRSHNTVIRINDTLFVHAGISPKYAAYSMEQINGRVREELADPQKLHGGIVIDEQGPLWYRGMASGDERALEPLVTAVLENFGAHRIVIGHAYSDGAITPRFDGKVILIDVGLPRIYDNVGKLACLEIDRDAAYAIHRGKKLEMPKDAGPDMVRYLKQAAALDPAPSPLAKRIANAEGGRR